MSKWFTAEGRPDPDQRGATFRAWVARLRRLGYRVEWQQLRACDYGVPTIRKRLFVVARCDGAPIVWPTPTHGKPGSPEVVAGHVQPWISAASIIDWSLPCPSIFGTSEEIMGKHGLRAVRPLKDATLNRIARGVMRYVVKAKQPFLISVAHGYSGGRREYPLTDPIGTQSAGGTQHALVSAFLAQHNSGPRMTTNAGRAATESLSTLTTRGTQQQIVAAHMMNMHGASRSARDITAPHPTVCAGGQHGALVAAFLQKYYGQGTGQTLTGPLHTLSTRDTFGLVTVEIDGQTYAITDIGMRMLTPREQFRAQGFPDSYIIDRGADGQPMTKTAQTRMCGNSVCPPLAAALVRANCAHLDVIAPPAIAGLSSAPDSHLDHNARG